MPFILYNGRVHRILLTFQLYKEKWRVGFLEADCKIPLPLRCNFQSPEKIRTMFRRNAKSQLLEDEQAMEHGIEIGRGGFWLELNESGTKCCARREDALPNLTWRI